MQLANPILLTLTSREQGWHFVDIDDLGIDSNESLCVADEFYENTIERFLCDYNESFAGPTCDQGI